MQENRALSPSRLGLAEGLELEGGTNVCLSEAAEQCENMCLGTVLKGAYASRGGQMGAQRSQALQRKGMWVGKHSDMNAHAARHTAIPGPSTLSMENRLVQCLRYPL